MANISKFFRDQWHDIKGNAKWDLIKWVVIGISAGIAAIVRIFAHASWWLVLVVFLAGLVCVALLFWLILKFIKSLNSHPDFEIEGISQDMPSFPKYFCQIRVHNRTPNTADNVRVELTEMESSTEEGERYLLPKLPLVLLPAEVSDKPSINPGGNLAFNLFNVTKHKSAHAPNLHIWIHSVIAKFTVGSDEEKSAPLGKAALFYNNKNYRLKIKVTARDFSPTESELNLNFTGEGSQCRFTLTPVK
jgi:uncharacterized protein (TIGR02588 family)